MTGFLIGIGAAGLRNIFDNGVVLEFSSESAFTVVLTVDVPSGKSGRPAVKDRLVTVIPASAYLYDLRVALPAGDSIVSITPVESLWFNSNTSVEIRGKLVKIYSVGSAYTGKIPAYGFQNATSLVEVNLPNCTSVRERAFSDCSALKKFVGGSLSVLDKYGFSGCTSLTDFTATRTEIMGRQVWDGCSALTDLSLPGCSYPGAFPTGIDGIGTLSALQYLRFPDTTLARVESMSGYNKSIGYRRGVTLVCSDRTRVI